MNPLILKYRPKALSDVIGQKAAVNSILHAFQSGPKSTSFAAHTFLITGPSGVGKTTLARIAARSGAGCAEEAILEIDAATYSGADDMREVAASMVYKPLVGKAKAVIVDEAHALSKQAVTALLKPFEEPPAHGFWFMCTTEAQKVPVAIKTRCLHLDLKPISPETMIPLLTRIAKAEKLLGGKNQTHIIEICAAEANGSPRQAISNLAACGGAETVDEAKELLASAIENSQAIDLARLLLNGGETTRWRDVQKLLSGMKDLSGESIRQTIRAYMTTCALSIPGGPKLENALAVLQALDQPCNPQDGISPIVVRLSRLIV